MILHMVSVYQLKPAFQKSLQPVLLFLRKKGTTANQITWLSIILSICLGGAFFFYQQFPLVLLLLPVGLLIRMALNALDGMMARQFKMQSQTGEVLNEMGDVLSDLVLILPFVIIPEIYTWLIVAFALLSILNEFAGLLGKAIGGERRYEGPMGKSDRALLIGVFCLGMYAWPNFASFGNVVFGLGIILLILSTFSRIRKALS